MRLLPLGAAARLLGISQAVSVSAAMRDAEHAGMLTCAMTYLHVHASGARLMPTPEAVHGVRVLPVADDAAEQVAHAIAAGDIDGAIHAATAAKAKPKKETP